MESNSLKGSSIKTVDLIELKFGIVIIVYHSTYFIDFGEFRIINNFYKGSKKKF